MRQRILALTCCVLVSCGTVQEAPIIERVSVTADYRGGGQAYNLSPSERIALEREATEGNIRAAARLVLYHHAVTGDAAQADRWERVVKKLRSKRSGK